MRSAGRDPRFDGLSGAFVDERFRKQYAFLFDEALPEEKRQLRSTLQARRILQALAALLAVVQAMCKQHGKADMCGAGCSMSASFLAHS